MKILLLALLLGSSLPVVAQESGDRCGRASIEAIEQAAPQKDPTMQTKIDRLVANLWRGHDDCIASLQRAHRRDQSLGIAARPRPAFVPSVIAKKPRSVLDTVGMCSVVDSAGKPCVRKISENEGSTGQPSEVVYANSCINPIEVSVIYNDASRGLATVKPGASAKLLCNGCGGVKAIEAVCR